MSRDEDEDLRRRMERREFIKKAAAGTFVVAFGGALYRLASDDLTRKARAQKRPDGRRRLPPGQKVLESLKPMGGEPGSPRPKDFRLKVHGEVNEPFEIDWDELMAMEQVSQECDVHCVTGWSMLGGRWEGVRIKALAERAGLKKTANFVVFEGAHGYTANLPRRAALADNVLVAHTLDGRPLAKQHGAPARALVPDHYFWKSAKWLQGIRFVKRDKPGYWETRGYHNYADPWKQQRYG